MTSKLGLSLVLGIAIAAAACSDESSMSQTGPSSASGSQAEGSPSGVIEIEGDVSRLSGSCPGLTFRVESQMVRTTSGTIYEHIKCSEIKNGLELEVWGRMQTDGSLAATAIQPEYY